MHRCLCVMAKTVSCSCCWHCICGMFLEFTVSSNKGFSQVGVRTTLLCTCTLQSITRHRLTMLKTNGCSEQLMMVSGFVFVANCCRLFQHCPTIIKIDDILGMFRRAIPESC